MEETEELRDVHMDLRPDAWRYKTGSGYSVTEGMDYELFTVEFRNLYEEIKKKEKLYTETVKGNIFLPDMLVQAEDEVIREELFTEAKRIIVRDSLDSGISQQEIFIGVWFIVLLFFILISLTFHRKKRPKTHEKRRYVNNV